jgi:hypothetical protein
MMLIFFVTHIILLYFIQTKYFPMKTSFITIVSLLLSSLAFTQTMTTEIYSKKINVIRRGMYNNGQLTINAYKHNAVGSMDTTTSFEIFLTQSEPVSCFDCPSGISVATTTSKTKLLKPDLDTIFNCFNALIPSIGDKQKKTPGITCSFYNFATGYNPKNDSHYISINDVIVPCNRNQIKEIIKVLKEVKAILIE